MDDNLYEIDNMDSLLTKVDFLEIKEKEAKNNLNESILDSINQFKRISESMKDLKFDTLISQSEHIIIDYNIDCLKDLNIIDDIKKLNYAEENVKNVIKVVDDLVDLRLCSKCVEESISSEDYEQASGYIYRYSKIDKHSLQEYMSPETRQKEINSSFELLNEMKIKLQNILLQKFEESIQKNDSPSIERYFKLLPLVGHHDAGLQTFINYLIKIIFIEYENSKKLMKNTEEELIPVVLMSKLLQIIAGYILKYQPMVDTYYGPGEVIYVAREIQSASVSYIKNLLNDFLILNKISEKLEYCRKNMEDPFDIISNLQKKSVWNFDTLLQSSSSILINFETYHRYLRKILSLDVNIIANDLANSKKDSFLTQISYHNSLVECRDEVLNIYINLECFYLKISCYKAFQINSINDDFFTSTAVDDSFYVFKKCLQRAFNTLTPGAIEAIFESIERFLITDYINFIAQNIHEFIRPDMIRNLAEVNGYIHKKEAKSLKLLFTAINNLQMSLENYEKMIGFIKNEIAPTSPDSGVITEKFSKSFEKLTTKCNSYKNEGYINIMDYGIKKIVENILYNLHNENHIISSIEDEATYNSYSSCVSLLTNFFHVFFKETKKILNKKSFDDLILIIIKNTESTLENRINHCLFNQLGALLLQQQISGIIKSFSDSCESPIRSKFNRIIKICNILSISEINPEEFHSTFIKKGDKIITYKEAVSFISLRVDFDNKTIATLKKFVTT